MKTQILSRAIAVSASGVSAFLVQGSCQACTACYGQSDSPLAAGMNWGIFSLLGFIGFVLAGVGGFAIFLMRRAAAQAESDPELHQAEFETLVSRAGVTVETRSRFRRVRPSCRENSSETQRVALER